MSENKTNIQWYPGHMTKAKRQMQEDLKLIDLIIEIVDARLPMSSRNPDIDKMGANKSRLILLNKSDLADVRANKQWIEFFKEKGYYVLEIDSKNRVGINSINNVIKDACKEKIERDRKRGILNRPVRAMVCGIPNVGKSTFINAYAKKACTKTGNKPGVTKGKQWIRMSNVLELLDTPGILWPKFEDEKIGINLALVGSINDDILDIANLSIKLIEFLKNRYSDLLEERYSISCNDENVAILEKIGRDRGCLKKGSEVDYDKAAALIIDDFRSGKIGKITLELPSEY